MRIFLAGATGVLGARLMPLLAEQGHHVTGMTRSPDKAGLVRELGGEPVICDALDATAVKAAVSAAAPGLIIDQLTDLPDDAGRIPEYRDRHNRIRREGIRNLLAAAPGIRVISQSIAWSLEGDAQAAVEEHERLVLDAGGVIVRYGQLYGPGTFYPHQPPGPPRIHVGQAARRTLDALGASPGTILTIDDTTPGG